MKYHSAVSASLPQYSCHPYPAWRAGLLLLQKLLTTCPDPLVSTGAAVASLLADLLSLAARGLLAPRVRAHLYTLVATMLDASGAAAASDLAPPLIECAWSEFYARGESDARRAGGAAGGSAAHAPRASGRKVFGAAKPDAVLAAAAQRERRIMEETAVGDVSAAVLLAHEAAHTPAGIESAAHAQVRAVVMCC